MKLDDRFPVGTIGWTVEDWQADAALIAEGDKFAGLALRCWAGSMSDRAMRLRLERFAAEVADEPADIGPRDAAIALAQHCGLVAVSAELTVELLAHLSVLIPGWEPVESEEIVALVRYTREGGQ